MSNFILDPVLANDTIELTEINNTKLDLCYLGLINDKRYPWLILVPKQEGLVELIDLPKQDRYRMIDEVSFVTNKMKSVFSPYKINTGALGNIVRQLHIHIIARQETDEAWPSPVWGKGTPVPYTEQEANNIINMLKN